MATNRTFTMIKLEAVENGHIGAILERINAAGFTIVAMKKTARLLKKQENFMPFTMNAHSMENS